MSEWQPIETAPKFRPILILKENQMGIAIYDEKVFGNWKLCKSVQFFKKETDSYLTKAVLPLPTHWMELPELPK